MRRRRPEDDHYIGIHNEGNGGMTQSAKIIRDAWAFGIIPETETCEGWRSAGIDDLWRQTQDQWEKYQFQVNNLPDDIKERFLRIQNEAFKRAREAGWEPDMSD